ncbi:MAG TPA: PIN domain-containing protein [Solirubrobacterales bacterium]|nr:PIN domain-containing protein [Solirubrobacterales bacterium]
MTTDRASAGLIDTSVLVAVEKGRPLRDEGLPERSAISIVTVAELRAGVLAAPDIESRDRRIVTLEGVRGATILPIEGKVARAWAAMRAYLAASERSVSVNDIWIAATAATHELPVITQDRDYYVLNGVMGLTVIPV